MKPQVIDDEKQELKRLEGITHSLVHELSKRLDGIWRCERYLAEAENNPGLQQLWSRLLQSDEQAVLQLERHLADEVMNDVRVTPFSP